MACGFGWVWGLGLQGVGFEEAHMKRMPSAHQNMGIEGPTPTTVLKKAAQTPV